MCQCLFVCHVLSCHVPVHGYKLDDVPLCSQFPLVQQRVVRVQFVHGLGGKRGWTEGVDRGQKKFNLLLGKLNPL